MTTLFSCYYSVIGSSAGTSAGVVALPLGSVTTGVSSVGSVGSDEVLSSEPVIAGGPLTRPMLVIRH